jgi:hypothetical protein
MSAPVTPTPEAVSGQPPLSEAQRIINVFAAPSKTFADLRRSAAWWGPFLVLLISSSAFVYTMQVKVGWDQVVQNMLANMSEKQKQRMEQAPPEQQQQQVKGMKIGVKYTSWVFWIFILVINAIFAALLMATFNFGLGASVSYSRAFAILMYAGLPGIFRSVLAIITMFAGADPEAFNLENPVGTNIAFYVDKNSVGALYPLLQTLDVITIWYCILAGIGFAVVAGKKKSTGIAVVFGWLALITLVRVGWAAIMG